MNLKIGANVKGLVKGLNKAQKESKKTGMSVKKLGLAMAGAAVGVAALDLAGKALTATFQLSFKVFKDSTLELAKFGDRMAKQARMVGVTAEQYQGFEFAAQRAGTSVQHVANGLKKLGRVMTDAQQGSRQLEETFEALGIKIAKADGTLRPVNDVFLELANKSEILGESAERTGVLMLLLGRSGTEMANMMENGADGITEVEDRLRDLNAMMSSELLANSEELIDAQADLEMAYRGMRIEIGKEVIPELTNLAELTAAYLSHMSKTGEIEDFGKAIAKALRGAVRPAILLSVFLELGVRSMSMYADLAQATLAVINKNYFGVKKNLDELLGQLREFPDAYDNIVERTDLMLGLLREIDDEEFRMFAGAEDESVFYLDLLQGIERQKIKDDLADRKRKRDAEAEAKRTADRARNRAKQEAKDLEKDFLRRLEAQIKRRQSRQDAFYEFMKEKDASELKAMFDAGRILEDEYLRRSLVAHTETANAKAKVDREALQGGFATGEAGALQKLALEQKIEQERVQSIEAGMAEANYAVLQGNLAQLDSYAELTSSVGSMFSSLSNLAMQAYEGGDEEAKKHAVALFHVSQALALATATMNVASGVAGALGNPALVAAFPANIIAAATVGAAGAAEIATIVGTSIQGIGDAGITSDMLKSAGLNNHSAIVMRNDETLLDPVGTKHITEMLAMQKAQMQNGGGEQTIRTTVELDGQVLGQSVDNYLIRQQERGLAYGNRVRQEYV